MKKPVNIPQELKKAFNSPTCGEGLSFQSFHNKKLGISAAYVDTSNELFDGADERFMPELPFSIDGDKLADMLTKHIQFYEGIYKLVGKYYLGCTTNITSRSGWLGITDAKSLYATRTTLPEGFGISGCMAKFLVAIKGSGAIVTFGNTKSDDPTLAVKVGPYFITEAVQRAPDYSQVFPLLANCKPINLCIPNKALNYIRFKDGEVVSANDFWDMGNGDFTPHGSHDTGSNLGTFVVRDRLVLHEKACGLPTHCYMYQSAYKRDYTNQLNTITDDMIVLTMCEYPSTL